MPDPRVAVSTYLSKWSLSRDRWVTRQSSVVRLGHGHFSVGKTLERERWHPLVVWSLVAVAS